MNGLVRKIISIDENKCDGCGLCIPSCDEGALQIVDGKARLVKDIYCDGLGNCLGECPQGAITMIEREAEPFDEKAVEEHLKSFKNEEPEAELSHWPVQLHLINPQARFLQESDLLIAADCVPFAYADFHRSFLAGRSLIIGCPKLDDVNVYHKKLVEIFKLNNLKSVTLVHMEVGCCFGLSRLVQSALQESGVEVELNEVIIGVDGTVKA